MTVKMATIVGVNGGFGRMFAKKLRSDGWDVVGVDLFENGAEATGQANDSATKNQLALVQENSSNQDVDCWLGKSPLVLLCVPTKAALWWLDHAAGLLTAESLCLDILSIKTEVTHLAAAAGFAGEYLSLHPMFAPRGEFSGLTMAGIPVQDGVLTGEFFKMMETWGCKVVRMEVDDHDRASAVMQAGMHAILLAMGRAAARSGVPQETLEALATPVSGPVSELIRIITDGDPATYAAIQRENPHARLVRKALVEALEDLDRWSLGDDSANFERMVDEIREGGRPK